MEIIVRGKNIEVSEVLRETAIGKMAKLDRFANGSTRAEIDFSELKNRRIHDKHVCEVLVHLKGSLIRSHAAAPEPFAALDLVIDKLEHQVKKLKEKRVSRMHPRPSRGAQAVPAVLGDDRRQSDTDNEMRIVKVKRIDIKPMPPEEAGLQMDLLGHDFFFFTNSETGRSAVIYRRVDGDLGLIDSES